MRRGHQERLAPLVAEAFGRTGIRPSDLGHIGVTLGPGSFTGVRAGLAFAKGLAAGLGLRLTGMGTLEALNHHPALLGRSVLGAIHGGRDHLYGQVGDGPPRALVPGHMPAADVLTGPAAQLVRDHYPHADIFVQDWPALSVLAALTLMPGHDDVTPLYMREADAVISTRGIITLTSA